MKEFICDKIPRILKNKKILEKKLNIIIENFEKQITIQGKPEHEYIAEKVIEALELGFPLSVALGIKEQDYEIEVLNIKEYTKRKDLRSVRARIIGKNGRTLKTLGNLTSCFFELKDNVVGIIGDPEQISNAREAIISLIRGAKQANVYSYLEKHHVGPIYDFGLKDPKNKF
ncbi:hypothetical protein FJZ20_00815 [Candidatus Pacearchaeota archaeon]|nr:hypothetical protein [Candidatus Pacearchaeota archaeon]